MIRLLTGSTHTGKTLLAQRLLERHGAPYLSCLLYTSDAADD